MSYFGSQSGQRMSMPELKSRLDSYRHQGPRLTVPMTAAQAFSACVTVEWFLPLSS